MILFNISLKLRIKFNEIKKTKKITNRIVFTLKEQIISELTLL